MENAVVYARYSSHAQSEQSIEGQLSAARNYARSKNYNIIHEYCDKAKTGTNDNRDEFQRMLKDTAKKKFSVIIVWKVDRFGRNREEITFNKFKCKKNGVRVEYVAENIAQGPEGVILESVLEGMAEYYSLQLSQNVARGYLESAKKFKIIGMAPLGYEPDEERKYKINENEAKVVKLIFDKFISGYSQFELIKYLNSHGYKNKRGTEFKKNSIVRIIKDDRYIGIYRFKGEILSEDAIPAIVDKETFIKANMALKNHKKMSYDNWNYEEYKLSDKCFCSKCNTKMKGSSGYSKTKRKYLYYVCPSCGKNKIRADKTDELILEKTKEILTEENIDKIVEDAYKYYLETDTFSSEIEHYEKIIAEIDKKISNLTKSVEDGMPYNLVAVRLHDLQKERDIYQKELNDLSIAMPITLDKKTIKTFLVEIKNNQKDSAFLNTFVQRIDVNGKELTITLNCVDTGLTVDSSTVTQQMGKMGHQSNFIVIGNAIILRVALK